MKEYNLGTKEYNLGTNFVAGGIESNPYFFSLVILAPFLSLLLAFLTSPAMESDHPGLATSPLLMAGACVQNFGDCVRAVWGAGLSVVPTWEAAYFLACFVGLALLLELLPGNEELGPETLTGHVPRYIDNGVAHCVFFVSIFWAGSNLGIWDLYDFGIFFDVFPGALATLNIAGLLLCVFLTFKGLYFPSTGDSGSSGSYIKDFLWGTELYPRVFGLDIKRFVNCRISMTFWQLAGLSFCYRSFVLHGSLDWGLFFSAISQFIYLFKFFLWECG
jgi:hypothetical protein